MALFFFWLYFHDYCIIGSDIKLYNAKLNQIWSSGYIPGVIMIATDRSHSVLIVKTLRGRRSRHCMVVGFTTT